MKSQTKSESQHEKDVSAAEKSHEEFFDETLSNLVQSWEVNVADIDLTDRVMAVITTGNNATLPMSEAVSQDYTRSFKVPFVDLKIHKPETNALKALNAEFARKHRVLPVRHEGRRLWVAMQDVHDTVAVDVVRMASGCLIQPMIADPMELEKGIIEAYGILEPPSPPNPPTAVAAPAPEPPDEVSRLLRETLFEMRAMRDEISALHREVAELRRERTGGVPRPSTARLFPFAPENVAHRNR
ncbi:MAG: hypothetical protein H8F28_02135 [Fibrella sp.]|nr:hypothetical protein [Armatimonadota bacterium]